MHLHGGASFFKINQRVRHLRPPFPSVSTRSVLCHKKKSSRIITFTSYTHADWTGSRGGLLVHRQHLHWFRLNRVRHCFLSISTGIGDGFNCPGASNTVAEWFHSQERSLEVAIFDSGSSFGGAVAALSIPLIAIKFGWRSAFVFSGLIGFVWLLMWLRVHDLPDRHPRVTPEELSYIRAGQDVPDVLPERGPRRWLNLARDRNVWGLVLGRALTDSIWWFYITWLPKYLSDARGFSLGRIALLAWIPFIAADLGNFTGGLISGYSIRRGVSVVRTRTWVCVYSCLSILAGIPAAGVHSVYPALVLICVALWGYASWSTMGLTLPSDLFPQDVVATVTGLSGLAAGRVGAVFTMAVGMVVDRFSYAPAFLVAGLLPLLATACVLFLVRAPGNVSASWSEKNCVSHRSQAKAETQTPLSNDAIRQSTCCGLSIQFGRRVQVKIDSCVRMRAKNCSWTFR
jgi:ACS family hexuronate transporter-like MFS transporter